MKVVRQARLELSGGSTPDQLRPEVTKALCQLPPPPWEGGGGPSPGTQIFTPPPNSTPHDQQPPRGNVSAPGIFLDPCPTSGLLGGALRGRT